MSETYDILQSYLSSKKDGLQVLPRITCNDGFSLSVQASVHTYCTPRSNSGPWSAVEVGFPSRIEPLLFEWAESWGQYTESVYGYVPVEVVCAVIELHGGFSEKSRLNRV